MSSETGKVTGKIENADRFPPAVITGQVCARHQVKQHDDGKPPWCHYCGKDDEGLQQARPNGGWGT